MNEVVKLKAKKATRYGNVKYRVGDKFEAPPNHAAVLTAAGIAIADDEPEPKPARKKRQYRRRDMVAEESP